MMNVMAIGPMLVLIVAVGGLVLLVRLVAGKGQRKGGIVVACMVLLMALAMFGVFLPRAAYSRAMEEQARAMAKQEEALRVATLRQESRGLADPSIMLPDLPAEPDSEDDEDQSYDAIAAHTDSAVEEIKSKVDEDVNALNSNVEASVRAVEVQVNRPIPPIPPRKMNKKSGRSSLPSRSSRAEIVTGILLLGVVLAGYFFLNANTRGHYTWRLRIGSTLVFVGSLAVILLICR